MNELKSLEELFAGKIFRIPDYQRGYAWEESQLNDFWEDLQNLQSDHYHYTGMVSLKLMTGEDLKKYQDEAWLLGSDYRYGIYSVVDGQQRLTTFVILIKSILDFCRDKLPGLEKIGDKSIDEIEKYYLFTTQPSTMVNNIVTYKFGYDVDNPSYNYFKARILEKDNSVDVDESFYTHNLARAKDFFGQRLQELYDKYGEEGITDVIVSLFRKLTQQMRFNEYLINDDFDVFVTFETMNNRGKKLSNLELLKNRLIYLSTIFPHTPNDRSLDILRREINEAWQEVYQDLGRNSKQMLTDDDFLRAHWMIYFGYGSHKKHDYANFLLKKFFVKQRVFPEAVTTTEIEDAEINTESTSEDMEAEEDDSTEENTRFYNKKLRAQEISDYVNSLKELAPYWYKINYPESSDWPQEIINWLQRLNRIQSANFRPLTLAIMAEKELSNAEKIEYLSAVERFVFFNFGLSGYQTSFRRTVFSNFAHSFFKNKDKRASLDKILTALKEIDCLRNDGERVILDISVIMPRINRLFQNYDGYYSWLMKHYFLYEYEAWLMAGRQAPHKTLSEDFFSITTRDKISIEHILPQNPNKADDGEGSWNDMLANCSTQQRKILTGSLGNLLALSEARNKSFQNDRFADKCNGVVATESRRGYTGYKDGSLSEVAVANSRNEKGELWWDENKILERGQAMLDFMAEHWGFEFYNDYDKVKLLYLEFVREQPENYSSMPKAKEETIRQNSVITPELVAAAYKYAKLVYQGEEDINSAADKLNQMGMNRSSAIMYLSSFQRMMKGEMYKRSISSYAENYYRQHILEDFGEEAAQRADESIKLNHQYLGRQA